MRLAEACLLRRRRGLSDSAARVLLGDGQIKDSRADRRRLRSPPFNPESCFTRAAMSGRTLISSRCPPPASPHPPHRPRTSTSSRGKTTSRTEPSDHIINWRVSPFCPLAAVVLTAAVTDSSPCPSPVCFLASIKRVSPPPAHQGTFCSRWMGRPREIYA